MLLKAIKTKLCIGKYLMHLTDHEKAINGLNIAKLQNYECDTPIYVMIKCNYFCQRITNNKKSILSD